MALLLSNATLTTERESGTFILRAVRAKAVPSKVIFSVMGPQRVQDVLIDPNQDVVEGDYLSVTLNDGTVRAGKASFVDRIGGGSLSYIKITVAGGLLPA